MQSCHTHGERKRSLSTTISRISTARQRATAKLQMRANGLYWTASSTFGAIPCCIDKRSSSELSEAINSMYRWYRDAFVCYAYLEDLTMRATVQLGNDYWSNLKSQLEKCRWFSRGWTLQELIAPTRARFFNKFWEPLAWKSGISAILSSITDIDQEILLDRERLQATSVAKRMSFASKRNTTRLEDQAYCLLGIFDVNMPLLYGEGPKAFQRLQEEIIRTWERVDHSILAWDGESDGLLSLSPSQFPVFLPSSIKTERNTLHDTGRPRRDIISWSLPQNETFELSNKGLRISLYAKPVGDRSLYDSNRLLVALNCSYGLTPDRLFAMYLRRRSNIHVAGMHDKKAQDAHEYAIYDFETNYTTVKISALNSFTTTTLTIARTAYYNWPRGIQVRLCWMSSRPIQRLLPGAAWDSTDGPTVDFSNIGDTPRQRASVAFKEEKLGDDNSPLFLHFKVEDAEVEDAEEEDEEDAEEEDAEAENAEEEDTEDSSEAEEGEDSLPSYHPRLSASISDHSASTDVTMVEFRGGERQSLGVDSCSRPLLKLSLQNVITRGKLVWELRVNDAV